jgi:phosphoglycolate phosphatase
MPKLIVFDLDGTTVDSHSTFMRAGQDYSTMAGLPPINEVALAQGYHAPAEHDFGWGVSREEQVRHFKGIDDMFNNAEHPQFPNYIPDLFPYVHETWMQLKNRGYVLAVATARRRNSAEAVLKAHDALSLFSHILGADDVAARNLALKPAPDALLALIGDSRHTCATTVMVGDTIMDLRMGRSADVTTIGVSWGFHPVETLAAEQPHHMLENDLRELLKIL